MTSLTGFLAALGRRWSAIVGFVLDVSRPLLKSQPVRFVTYGTAAFLTVANAIGHALGYTVLPDGITNGVTILGGAILAEVLQRLVYSPNSVADVASASPAIRAEVSDQIDAGARPTVADAAEAIG
jgi:uncharacterized membrane protein YvlD (DUF360 family)